jgi:hypothetical protein
MHLNTKIIYQYRDAENYKKWTEVVIRGELLSDAITPLLYEGEFFIPSEIGLDNLQKLPFKYYDHVWHEILEIYSTNNQATVNSTADKLLEHFEQANDHNWNIGKILK